MNVRPSPKMPVPVTAVMTLHPVTERLITECSAIQSNLTGENRIRMRRPRKPNPALAAQLRSKNRPVSQIPGNSLPANFHTPPTFVLANPILTYLQKKRIGSALAHSSTV
jgi:hypothetical protein